MRRTWATDALLRHADAGTAVLMRMLLREIDSRADGCEMVCQDILEVLLVKIVRRPPCRCASCSAAVKSKEVCRRQTVH